MCAPAIPLIAAGLAAAAGGIATVAKIQQANMEAKVADANAQAERAAAQQDQTNMQQAALQRYRQIAQVQGQQQAAAAANGVSLGFGTAAQQVGDTQFLGSEDVSKIYQQGYASQRNHDVAIANDLAQASAARASVTTTAIGGALNFGSTVLGGVSQYQQLKNKMGSSGTAASYG